jgi:hypothetical protein
VLRKVKDGNVEIVECDLDPIVTGRILEGIVNMNAAIVSLLGLSVATNDQVNRDAASGVPTPNPANTAAPVQRMVRCNLRLGFKLLDECRFDCVVWENTPITGAWWHCRLSENASKQFGMSLKHQIEIGSCSLEDVREIQSYFDEGFLHSGFVLGASSHLDLSEHCQPEVQIWSEGIVKPEKLVMHPDMKDEEWARWDCVLSELSKTTSLAPFCSGISTEQQSESDVLPYEYDTLKTNDQVNRDAASDVPTPIPATTAAPVQRFVRFLRLIASIAFWPLRFLRFAGMARSEQTHTVIVKIPPMPSDLTDEIKRIAGVEIQRALSFVGKSV